MPPTGNQRPQVLIADDDPGILEFLADRCAKMGFGVRTATNGLQAMIMAMRNQPDVLIVDVNMPGLDGLSVCMRLLSPDRRSVDAIVVTGSSNPETAERCGSLGIFYARKGPDMWDRVRSALSRVASNKSDWTIAEVRSPLPVKMWQRPRVLVVDDDPDVELFLSSRLGKCGVDTLFASDAVKGYRIACKEKPSVIISDYFMPNGDAVYLLWKLRSTPSTANIPFFVMSERPLDEVTKQSLKREVCGRPGAARILNKSFDTQELFAALQCYCAFDHKPQTGPAQIDGLGSTA
jgi:CheY-like chemotaxis protein